MEHRLKTCKGIVVVHEPLKVKERFRAPGKTRKYIVTLLL